MVPPERLRRELIASALESVSDVERLIGRVRIFAAAPRDLVGLAASLEAMPRLKEVLLEDDDSEQVRWLADDLSDTGDVVHLIRSAIRDDPPATASDGNVIREGFSSDLDSLRDSARGAQSYIAGLEQKERARTGIKSLKVGYNRVFGYYIEVSRANLSLVPEEYVRRQTLVGGRAIYNAGDEGVRVAGPQRPGADQRARSLPVSPGVRAGGGVRVPGHGRREVRRPSRRVRLPGGGRLQERLRQAAAGRGRHHTDQGGASPGGGADAAVGVLRAQRHLPVQRGRADSHPDRAQHVGKVDLHPPGSRDRPDGAGGELRPRRVGLHRPGRQDIHPRRPPGRPVPGTVHLHGGDAGDGLHPESRHETLPDHPGRDRPGVRAPTTASP